MNSDSPISKPQIVWSDEVGRATEAAGLAAFAFFPDALLRMLSGDPKQCEAVASSTNAANLPKEHEKTRSTRPSHTLPTLFQQLRTFLFHHHST
ncbi:hypothetical protein PG996_008967 [Apiospora saccharicola]|uniref:Uncharacterized protein n=1 Tax=Apiospora saccharicola TaxID=335842 RepID=A0ABR1UZH5_9PEZI